MSKKFILGAMLFALVGLDLAACNRIAAPTPAPIQAPIVSPTIDANTPKPSGKSSSPFGAKSNSGGSVDVGVTPAAINIGEPIAFEIAMNTHSVELSDDLLKIAILRDEAGNEYKPTTWEGGEPGGHHRVGILKFTALMSKPKYLELVIQGLARVPERVFHWEFNEMEQ